jgi:uncharacterized cupin superfamily protein
MSLHLSSTAPHVHAASTFDAEMVDWAGHQNPLDGRSRNRGRLLYKSEDGLPEAGIWRATPGSWRPMLPADELCYFTAGRATYRSDGGEVIDIAPGTLVHFKEGWQGEAEITETIFVTYMFCEGGPATVTPVLRDPATLSGLEDWGVVPTMITGTSKVSGLVLSCEPDGRAESGVWACTPGKWRCTVTRDEFCHFLSGRATYVHESGDVVEIAPDTAAFFPRGWTGTCTVHQTVRKIYLIR